MSLDKALKSGKEKRKISRGGKAVSNGCRNHGSCPYCDGNRKHNEKRRLLSANEQLQEENND